MSTSPHNTQDSPEQTAAEPWEAGGASVAQAEPAGGGTPDPQTRRSQAKAAPSQAAPATEPSSPPVATRKLPVRWTWNRPLLSISLVGFVLGSVLLVGLYRWQSARIGEQLRQLAEGARVAEDVEQQVEWLQRYLALRPDDVEAQIELAWAFDGWANRSGQIDQSRRFLSRAITAAEAAEQVDTRDALRRRLIDRLLQLGGGWLGEAQRQIILLNPPPEDPQGLAQLAEALLGQFEKGGISPPADPPAREEHFWKWAAAQPVGEVLRMAVVANPESIAFRGALVSAYLEQPEMFDAPGAPADRQQFPELAAHLVQQLGERKDSGHAQWIAYRYGSQYGSRAGVEEPAQAALQRLQARAAQLEASPDAEEAVTDVSANGGASSREAAAASTGAKGADATAGAVDAYQPYWDVQLALTYAAMLSGDADYAAAEQLYASLAALPEELLAGNQLEVVYWGLGQTRWELGELAAARDAWQSGNERLGGSRLLLLEPLAAVLAESGRLEDAKQAVERLGEAVQAASTQLAGTARGSIPEEQRNELQRQLNAANWRVDVLRAQLDYREGNARQATSRLERALASQLVIQPAVRLEAASLLAKIHGEQGLWDLAGRVLDEAVSLAPDNQTLRRQAAHAWRQAAVDTRVAAHLQHADDGSVEAAFSYAQALMDSLSAQLPARRDYAPLWAAIDQAERRLEAAAEGTEDSSIAWRLRLLKLAASGSDPEQKTPAPSDAEPSSDDERQARRGHEIQVLRELCAEFPQEPELQALAALSLESRGEPAGADAALQQLKTIADADSLLVLQTEAQLAAMRGNIDAALEQLDAFAAAHPAQRLRVVSFSASWLESWGRLEQAVERMLAVEPQRRKAEFLTQLGDRLLKLAAARKEGEARSDTIDAVAELEEVERQLQAVEGPEGTQWRWLAANRLLLQASGMSTPDPLLAEAAERQQEIARRRPRWAPGLTLAGRIAAGQGNPQQAVELLRRAISEGDRQIGTVLLLVRQLNQLGDFAAAEQELARLQSTPDAGAQIAALAIDSAVGQKEFARALQVARSAVQTRPDDHGALLILAQTASLAAGEELADQERRTALLTEAAQALAQAREVTGGRELRVWDALFRFRLAIHGPEAAAQVLEALEASPLAEKQRWLAAARGYLALGELDRAEPLLEKAVQVNATDPNVQLGIADLRRARQDSKGMLEALEAAHRLAPERSDISSHLAFALVANSATEIPWDRISQLVGEESPEATEKNRIHHALMVVSRGDAEQIEETRRQLQQLTQSPDAKIALDAQRLLAIVAAQAWKNASADRQSDAAQAALSEARRLFELLVQRPTPEPSDLYRYGDLLLRAELTSEAARVVERLTEVAPASQLALDLQLRQAVEGGDADQVAGIVDRWLQSPGNENSSAALAVAGLKLARLGVRQQSVERLQQAYEREPRQLRNYVSTLVQAGDIQRAVTLCMEHFRTHGSPEPVALVADVIATERQFELLDAEVVHFLAEGSKRFSGSVRVLEALGTLHLTQHQYAEAVEFYRQAEKIEPGRLVTLNNLALALAEISGRQSEGLPRIERAVELYGRNPELLDTLGVVQFHCGLLEEAEATLREATAESENPLHLFHLVMVLHARHKQEAAQRSWNQLDLSALEATAMSPSERQQFEQLQKHFGEPQAAA